MQHKKAEPTDYLAFCDHCGFPQPIPPYILKMYWGLEAVHGYWCGHCGFLNEIPAYLKNISHDL